MVSSRLLQASPYYWERIKGESLAERHRQGKLGFMLFNQPPLCDAHCRRCFMPPERRRLSPERELRREEWFGLIDQGKERGLLSIEISGEGEPLLSAHTLPIIRYASSHGILTSLITNGHALSEDMIAVLLEANATLIFSLHTLDGDKYEKDNLCPGSFETKMRSIEAAAKFFDGSAYLENDHLVQRLAVHTTLQADNLDEIEDIRRFCHERSMFFSIAPLANSGNATSHPKLWLGRDMADVTGLGDNSIIHSETSEQIYGREVCGTAAFGMSIGFDGNLLLDAHGGYEISDALGNIRTHSFDELFQRWRIVIGRMFQAVEGFCPVRDSKRFSEFILTV